jgi:glycosyltransferase involved in cell wall biosynthesis
MLLGKVSIIIPGKGRNYIKYSLSALRSQTIRLYEDIIVIKGCDIKEVKISAIKQVSVVLW